MLYCIYWLYGYYMGYNSLERLKNALYGAFVVSSDIILIGCLKWILGGTIYSGFYTVFCRYTLYIVVWYMWYSIVILHKDVEKFLVSLNIIVNIIQLFEILFNFGITKYLGLFLRNNEIMMISELCNYFWKNFGITKFVNLHELDKLVKIII